MRWVPLVVAALVLSGCETLGLPQENKAVDANALAPLSSREQALLYGADGAFQQGNFAAAERDYLSAVAQSTGHVDAHLALARLYEKQGFPEKEKMILERALELQPNHPFANYLLGKLHLEANRYALALKAFQQGRVTRADDIDLAIGEAVAQDMLGDHGAAQKIYAQVIRSSPHTDIARTNLAMSYLLSNDPQRAVELLQVAAGKPASSPVTRHNLALAYGLLGRHADAKAVLKGDIDEETRMLAVARMKAYHGQRDHAAPPLVPTITQVAAPVEPVVVQPVPVIKHSPVVAKTPEAKKAHAPMKASVKEVTQEAVKPAEKIEQKAEQKPEPAAAPPAKPAPAATAKQSAPPAHPASKSAEPDISITKHGAPADDPNYIPGLTDSDTTGE